MTPGCIQFGICLAVADLGSDFPALRDLKPPIEIPVSWSWLWWTALLVTAIFLATSWMIWRRRQRAIAGSSDEISVPPHERARDRLREALDLLHQPEPYCMAISGALRSYLGERFHWHAVERTTHEFIQEIRGDPALSDALKTDLQGILTTCDLVKFARDEPSITDLRGLYDSAWHLVLQTTLEETPTYEVIAGEAVTES